MNLDDFYKKKDHKVTIKRYGFMNWYGYNMHNYPMFKLLVYIVHIILGIIIGIILKNR